MPQTPVGTAAHQNLRTLCLIRLIPFSGQALAIGYLYLSGAMVLPWGRLSLLLAVFAAVIALSWWRALNPRPIHDREFFAQLVVDVTLLSLLLYHTGGATNPFVSYYLVPITIAAITLPRPLTILISLSCLLAYSALMFWHVTVPDLAPAGHGHGGDVATSLNVHVIGMWVNFTASALLIIWFVTRMAETVRIGQQALLRQQAAATERQLEDEQLLAVATLAASAAHDLGTPLNTVRLIVDDWRRDTRPPDTADHRADLDTIAAQVERCQHSLKKLGDTARVFSRQEAFETTARQYFTDLVDRWLLMRPDVRARCRITGDDTIAVHFHPSLSASIHNILNNAGDASPAKVEIDIHWNAESATLAIRDHGPGIDPLRLSAVNALAGSDKSDGLGLGLFLSRSIFARHGAAISLTPQAEGGTLATIHLPLTRVNTETT
ncbi:MAG: ATP-binding protein [Porticoccaceae bacterium]|jgi:two-component system sensor histidine kinase RegB